MRLRSASTRKAQARRSRVKMARGWVASSDATLDWSSTCSRLGSVATTVVLRRCPGLMNDSSPK
jgi:hypothetical protein